MGKEYVYTNLLSVEDMSSIQSYSFFHRALYQLIVAGQ